MAMNALLGKNSSHNNSSGSHGNSSSPLGGLASQLISGIGGHGNNNANTSSGGKSSLGKLGGALASSFLNKPQQQQQQQGQQGYQGQQQNYHGSQSTGHQQQHGGLAGSLMGGVANMFGGNKPAHGVGSRARADAHVTLLIVFLEQRLRILQQRFWRRRLLWPGSSYLLPAVGLDAYPALIPTGRCLFLPLARFQPGSQPTVVSSAADSSPESQPVISSTA